MFSESSPLAWFYEETFRWGLYGLWVQMSQYTVLFDANGRYPAPMRDALIKLKIGTGAVTGYAATQQLENAWRSFLSFWRLAC
ncbi:hypothetical protein TQ29_18175 (plasmid) [Actibacterium sp. EMB200-NS6]|nr:hypothetical protein TQ29_18175 [Actibacterium sp. EMB200-NS6]